MRYWWSGGGFVLLVLFALSFFEAEHKKFVDTVPPEQVHQVTREEDDEKREQKEALRLPPPPLRNHVVVKQEERSAAPKSVPSIIQVTSAMKAEGRATLIMMEQGGGPRFQFHWPVGLSERRKVLALLQQCYGAQMVLYSEQGLRQWRKGVWQDWQPDRYIYSTLLRDVSNVEGLFERQVQDKQALPGLVVTRDFDALTIGGLVSLAQEAREFEARYHVENNGLRLINLVADGASLEGQIELNGGTC